jgi:hypothetical protein
MWMGLDIQRRLEGRLLPGERVLWTGRPKQGLLLSAIDLWLLPMILLTAAPPLLILTRAVRSPIVHHPSEFVGVIFPFLVILLLIAIRAGMDIWLRARTFYGVTDRRILIWRDGPLASYKVLDRARISAVELRGGGRRGSIRFGTGSTNWGGTPALFPILAVLPQFLAIENPRQVFDLIQETQPEAAAAA